MTFTEFAEAIEPYWLISSARPSKNSSYDSDWLTSVWNSADNRWTYCINWRNDALKNELPPDAHQYRFDDLLLHPITERLGLDPGVDADNCKAAELLAIRNAWITAIQQHYGQSTTDIPGCTLTNAAASEYVLLTSGLIHPWIQERTRQHIADQNRKKLEQADKANIPVEMSSNPNWPSAQVIHARATEPSPHEQAMHEEEMKGIRYWLEKFKSEDGCWSSEFEMDAWDAQSDIDIANQKIAALQKIIGKQQELIKGAQLIIKRNKRHEAAMRKSKKIGRPEKSTERQNVATKFTAQWVKSLMDALNVNSCAKLGTAINDSSERNWRRWLNREALPSPANLSALLSVEITQGSHKGKPLLDVTTNPEHNDLLSLIHLT